MKSLCKRLMISAVILCMALSGFPGGVFAASDDIVILYENDVHCAIDGYSKLAAMKKELQQEYAHVGVVSSGDFVQGTMLGTVSRGEYVVNLMNRVGYDAIALGNHEFDYQLARLDQLNAMSNTDFLSCNFQKIGETGSYFDPYTIVSYGNVDIAYVAITTPDTIHLSSPAQFQNEKGEYIYTFNPTTLYDIVQKNINAVRLAGADYVVALSHLGYSESGASEDVIDLIENTQGLDVVLDAHTHTVIEEKTVKDKSGNQVLLSSTGTKFEYVGKLTVKNGTLHTALVKMDSYTKTDPAVDAYIREIQEGYSQLGNRVIGQSKVELITHDANGNRLVRTQETNLGDFCSDALRIMTGADVSYVNGGGLRNPMDSGEVTFNDVFSLYPFDNQVVTVEVTGQILLDFLEMTLKSYPQEDGSFPHVSGMVFSVNRSIPSSVRMDENGVFEKVDGAYRVYNVKVWDKVEERYVALDLKATYVLASLDYYLLNYGGGASMLKEATVVDGEGTLIVELLEAFVAERLGGVIGESYGQVQLNLTFTDGVIDSLPEETEPGDGPSPETGDSTCFTRCLGGLALVFIIPFYCKKRRSK